VEEGCGILIFSLFSEGTIMLWIFGPKRLLKREEVAF
jgi:hypothetical protein